MAGENLTLSVELRKGGNKVEGGRMMCTIPARYQEGHVLTAFEAAALSQTLKENIANWARGVQGQAQLVKIWDEGGKQPEIQAAIMERYNAYQFGPGGGSGFARLDPETAAIRQLAQNVALKEFQRSNPSLSKSKIIASEEYAKRVTELEENPKIQAAAKDRLAQESEDYS